VNCGAYAPGVFSATRDEAYTEVFGTREYPAYPDESEESPRIEVRRYTFTGQSREWDIWVTSGMSDLAMRDDDGDELRRELIFYAEKGGDFSGALRAVAKFPFEERTYLALGHTVQTFGSLFVPHGVVALASEDISKIELPHLFISGTVITRHQRLPELLVIDGCPVDFLCPVPISQAELDYKRESGTQALLDLFDEHEHSWLFDPERESYLE
jgi:hypothetical protein